MTTSQLYFDIAATTPIDEEVASLMVEGFGGTVTKLTKDQADYINVPQDGPFKEESYKY